MGSKTTIAALLLLLGLADGLPEVNMTGGWKPRFGWQMTCVWTLNWPLQSVRLYRNETQFLIFRPEKQGPNISSVFEPEGSTFHDGTKTRMIVNCYTRRLTGQCDIGVELMSAPIFDNEYKCEVSEERPKFEMRHAIYLQEVFVDTSYPQLEVTMDTRINVNCSATGIPAPRLLWRIGEQRIPQKFSRSTWDFETKLWHSWSEISIERPSEDLFLSCTAISSKTGRKVEEKSVDINLNSAGLIGTNMVLIAVTMLALLLR